MPFTQWHRNAITPAPAPPAPIERVPRNRDERRALATIVTNALRGQPVRSPLHELLLDEIDRAFDRSLAEPEGDRTILGVSGPSGTGKTTQVKAWARYRYRQSIGPHAGPEVPRWSPQPGVDATHVPVIWVSLQAKALPTSLYKGILASLDLGVGGNRDDLFARCVRAFHNHGVKLLVFDDANQVHTGPNLSIAVMEALKSLSRELGNGHGSMVLVSTDRPDTGVFGDYQIKSRLWLHKFGPYTLSNAIGRERWTQFLTRIEDRVGPYLVHDEPGFLTDADPEFIWHRTQGYAGDTLKLVLHGVEEAIANNRAVSRRDLEQAPLSQRAHLAFEQAARQAHKSRQAS